MRRIYKIFVCTTAISAMAATAAMAESQVFDIKGFSEIEASAGVTVEISVGGEYSVRAEGAQNALERLKLVTKNETLKIGRKNRKLGWKRQPKVTVYVTMPALDGVGASSGSDVEATGIDAGRFSVNVSSGADVSLAGQCNDLSASVSSGSDLDGESLQCRNANVTASSGADASIYASEKVTANASSGGDIAVYGGPEHRTISKSSGGDISIHN